MEKRRERRNEVNGSMERSIGRQKSGGDGGKEITRRGKREEKKRREGERT